MRQQQPRHLSKHQPRLLRPIERARRAPVVDHAIMVSGDAMAAETTPPVIVVTRTRVPVGTTIVVTATTVTAAEIAVIVAVKVASEAKAACARKVAAMAAVIVVAKVGVLASALRVAAVVTGHAARAGRTQVAG